MQSLDDRGQETSRPQERGQEPVTPHAVARTRRGGKAVVGSDARYGRSGEALRGLAAGDERGRARILVADTCLYARLPIMVSDGLLACVLPAEGEVVIAGR